MIRAGAAVVLAMLAAPAPAQSPPSQQQPLSINAAADQIAQALTTCHDGTHAIDEAEVDRHSLAFRAGSREWRVFLGAVSVTYAEPAAAPATPRRDARVTLRCTRAAACLWSGPWDESLAAARDEHGIALLSKLPLRHDSLMLVCPDSRSAQSLHRGLQALLAANAH